MNYRFDICAFIGRFQIFHFGQAAVLTEALKTARKVVVVLGSSFGARTPKNPFTWEERAAMIRASLAPEDAARVTFEPVRDYYDDARWGAAVRKAVLRHADAGQSVALAGYLKDRSSSYQNDFPEWESVRCDRYGKVDGTVIREMYFDAPVFPAGEVFLRELVPSTTVQFLRAFTHLPEYGRLCREAAVIAKNKAEWRGAPHAPKFLTADAVVTALDHVLLIQRSGDMGEGLWALPGGHMEEYEWSHETALRELREETQLAPLDELLRAAHKGYTVFQHPLRSLRGRTVTFAHRFELGHVGRLPAVCGNGSEGEPRWVPLTELAGMEARFFEDHFMILDHFLGLTHD